ncbi:MAG: type II/IV secretion system protein, partial [Cyanobacteria bacterium P01_G01_bin.19]
MAYSSKKTRAIALRSNLSPFGNQLVQKGFIDGDKMQKALAESRKTGRSLVEILESATGKQLPPELLRQYKKHHLFELKILYGVESVDPEIETDKFADNQMEELIDSLIPLDICRRYRLIPLRKEEGEKPALLVAMVDPENLEAQDDLNRILRPKGIKLKRQV